MLFANAIDQLISPSVNQLKLALGQIVGLTANESALLAESGHKVLLSVSYQHVIRVLLLELNIARKEQRLAGQTPEQRWQSFVDKTLQADFWSSLQQPYPSLLTRIEQLLAKRCQAICQFAQHWAADKSQLSQFFQQPVGEIQTVSFDHGDSHDGKTVVIVVCQAGKIVYKPRSMAIDVVLNRFIQAIGQHHRQPITARIPSTLDNGDHGWAEFIEHCYCSDASELNDFYQGIGQWLAILRLIHGADIHAQNLIAAGKHPTIIDCETMFTPKISQTATGYGQAVDEAINWLSHTVLSSGMLPGKCIGLGWHGVDISALGALSANQTRIAKPTVLKAGTDEAYLGSVMVDAPAAQNQPSQQAVLADYQSVILTAFEQLNITLQQLDQTAMLERYLADFAACHIRVVPRPTEAYGELERMLWHPVSLHNENEATDRARYLLTEMAKNSPIAPSCTRVIEAEITDLKIGQIPYFSTQVANGVLQGPQQSQWLAAKNLLTSALSNWRATDLQQEKQLIQTILDNAEQGKQRPFNYAQPWLVDKSVDRGELESRRRRLLGKLMADFLQHAIYGQDGSVTWIASHFDPNTGWSVRPLGQDLYSGLLGVALVVAAYLQQSRLNQVDPIAGLDKLQQAIIFTLKKAENQQQQVRQQDIKMRPAPLGAYTGLGGRIWGYLTLERLGYLDNEALTIAQQLAQQISQTLQEQQDEPVHDLLHGSAGAIVPLLALYQRTGLVEYLTMAEQLAQQLKASAMDKEGQSCWPHPLWPEGIGGFSHGATGIGWALMKLAQVNGAAEIEQLAKQAFAYEASLFDEQTQAWLDLRHHAGKTATAWCHGAVGIGLAHLSLDPHLQQASTVALVKQAVADTLANGFSQDHCLCHGCAAAWELLTQASHRGLTPTAIEPASLLAAWLTEMELHGTACDKRSAMFQPGLMTGSGGIIYQLLTAHPDSQLPSILTLD